MPRATLRPLVLGATTIATARAMPSARSPRARRNSASASAARPSATARLSPRAVAMASRIGTTACERREASADRRPESVRSTGHFAAASPDRRTVLPARGARGSPRASRLRVHPISAECVGICQPSARRRPGSIASRAASDLRRSLVSTSARPFVRVRPTSASTPAPKKGGAARGTPSQACGRLGLKEGGARDADPTVVDSATAPTSKKRGSARADRPQKE